MRSFQILKLFLQVSALLSLLDVFCTLFFFRISFLLSSAAWAFFPILSYFFCFLQHSSSSFREYLLKLQTSFPSYIFEMIHFLVGRSASRLKPLVPCNWSERCCKDCQSHCCNPRCPGQTTAACRCLVDFLHTILTDGTLLQNHRLRMYLDYIVKISLP